MEENQIRSLSVEMLNNYIRQHHSAGAETVTHKHCIVGRASKEMAPSSKPFFDQPCRIDAVALWLCTEGSSTLTLNLEDHQVQKGSFIILPPKSIAEMKIDASPSYGGYVIIIDPNFLGEADLNLKKIIGTLVNTPARRGVIQLNDTACKQMTDLFELAISTLNNPSDTPCREDIIRTILSLFIYQSCDLIATETQITQQHSAASTRTEEYFRRFIKELSEHYLERQNVTFYADRLCISSRYLTTIVRRVSGLSVTDWMNRYVITEAKYLLKYSDMSIQEIAYKLNFPNQSFFGKYFKQHIGMSPSTYRQKQ